jgi:AcrR family transcriptional regulator
LLDEEVMGANVVADNNDVNVNTVGYAATVADSAIRPYHHGNLRAALLERAEQIVAERGAQALSLRELAREVGVSHAAPRRHFADRRALLLALAEDGFARLGRSLTDAIEGAGGSFAAQSTALAAAYVHFATEHAALLELMFASKRAAADDGLHEAAMQAFAAPLALILEGQEGGDLRPGDPQHLGVILFAMLHGLAALANGGMLGGEPLDALVEDAVGGLLRGLRPA